MSPCVALFSGLPQGTPPIASGRVPWVPQLSKVLTPIALLAPGIEGRARDSPGHSLLLLDLALNRDGHEGQQAMGHLSCQRSLPLRPAQCGTFGVFLFHLLARFKVEGPRSCAPPQSMHLLAETHEGHPIPEAMQGTVMHGGPENRSSVSPSYSAAHIPFRAFGSSSS